MLISFSCPVKGHGVKVDEHGQIYSLSIMSRFDLSWQVRPILIYICFIK